MKKYIKHIDFSPIYKAAENRFYKELNKSHLCAIQYLPFYQEHLIPINLTTRTH